MTRVDVRKWVTMSGGVLPQGGGIQFCRLLALRSMYDPWHTVPDQLCSICLIVEVGATAPCVSRRIWRSHAWPRATSSPTPSPTHTSTSARRDCARRRARHGGDPPSDATKSRRPPTTVGGGCACGCLLLAAGLARVVAHGDALETGGPQDLEDLVEEDHRFGCSRRELGVADLNGGHASRVRDRLGLELLR